jgi:magnesium chelatase family protein
MRCKCSYSERIKYLGKISGPILDRFDLIFVMENVGRKGMESYEGASSLREKVSQSQERLKRRFGKLSSHLSPEELESLIKENPGWANILRFDEVSNFRSRHKKVRVALSMCAWDGSDDIEFRHGIEVDAYRIEKLTQ